MPTHPFFSPRCSNLSSLNLCILSWNGFSIDSSELWVKNRRVNAYLAHNDLSSVEWKKLSYWPYLFQKPSFFPRLTIVVLQVLSFLWRAWSSFLFSWRIFVGACDSTFALWRGGWHMIYGRKIKQIDCLFCDEEWISRRLARISKLNGAFIFISFLFLLGSFSISEHNSQKYFKIIRCWRFLFRSK